MIGGLIGAGFGLFLGIAAWTDNSGSWEVGVDDVAAVTAIVGASGAGVGGTHREPFQAGSVGVSTSLTPRVAGKLRARRNITGLTLRF